MNAKKKRYQAIQDHLSTHGDAPESLLSEEPKKYDPTATTDDLLADLRRVQKEHPDLYISRRAYRKFGKYSDSTWDSRFGTFHEYRRQARLELSRGQHNLERQIAAHASRDVYRGFAEVEILPWVGKYAHDITGRHVTMVVASDFHDRETDPFALSVFLSTCKRVQPDIISLAGDVFDSYEFSRFDKDPRSWDAAGRLAWVRDNIFAPLREACPNAQIDLLAGNHEHHLLRHMAERTPEMKAVLSDFMGLTLADLFGLPKFKINLICKHDLSAYFVKDLREEVAKNRKTYFGCVTVDHYPDTHFSFGTNSIGAHSHKPSLTTGRNEVLGPVWSMTLGCMCRCENSYTDKNRNQHGFALVHIDTHTKQAVAEPIIFTDDTAYVGGIRYERPL